MRLFTLVCLLGGLIVGVGKAQTQPLPDTYFSTGMITNFSTPYHPAPYGAVGTLVTSSTATLPTYVGMRYELYRDAKGQPAYAGLATAKVIVFRQGRFFGFADGAIGGAGSTADISSVLQIGGGVGIQLGKYSATNTPHWELVVEPQARRIPALANGTQPAFLVGISYSFNKPKTGN